VGSLPGRGLRLPLPSGAGMNNRSSDMGCFQRLEQPTTCGATIEVTAGRLDAESKRRPMCNQGTSNALRSTKALQRTTGQREDARPSWLATRPWVHQALVPRASIVSAGSPALRGPVRHPPRPAGARRGRRPHRSAVTRWHA
jgi:hypothetical protein